MDNWLSFLESLEEGGGVGHVRDGESFGLSRHAISAYWRRRRWPMPHPGVVVLPGTDMTHAVRAIAAARWVGEPVVVTAASSLHLHGVVDRAPSQVSLVVPHSRRNRRTPDVVVHRSDLTDRRSTVEIGRVHATTPAWALRDRAVFGGPGRIRTLAILCLQRRKATLDALFEAAGSSPTATGIPDLLETLETIRRDRVDSGVELDTRHLVRADGYEPWPRPFPWRCPDGRVIHLDVAFPPAWFAIECDDPSTHGSNRAFYIDRTRWTQAMNGGWRLAFVWRERLRDDPLAILKELATAFREADPRRPPPEPAHECGDRCPL